MLKIVFSLRVFSYSNQNTTKIQGPSIKLQNSNKFYHGGVIKPLFTQKRNTSNEKNIGGVQMDYQQIKILINNSL